MTVLISAIFLSIIVAGLSILSFNCYSFYIKHFLILFIFDHKKSRINSFWWNRRIRYISIDLSLTAFKNGGLLGKGPGQGILKEKYLMLKLILYLL